MSQVRDQDKLMIRLPDGMRDTIKIEATKNRRSMNAEVVMQLERAYGLQKEAAGDRIAAPDPAASRNTAALPGGDIING